MDENYKRAKDLLKGKKALLESMAKLLLQEETIYGEEVDDLIAGKSPDDIVQRLHEKEQKRKEKEDVIRKENELVKQAKLQELKIKAAEALKDAGVIGNDEFDKLVSEYERVNKEKDEYLNKRNEELEKKTKAKLEESKKARETEEKADDKPKKVKSTSRVKKLSNETVGKRKTEAKSKDSSKTKSKTNNDSDK